jgi:hypothetical protein
MRASGALAERALENIVRYQLPEAKVIHRIPLHLAQNGKHPHEADAMPYIEILTDYWGELCVTPELAIAWADELVGSTRMALSSDKSLRGHYHGTTACLDALLHARRFAELHDILKVEKFWHYKRWAVKALAAEGKADEAIALAEASRGPWTSETDVNRLCEGILLSLGRTEEAYLRYGLNAHRAGTYLATFRAVAKAYPSIPRDQILSDLIELSPGDKGKWFATAKELGLYEVALDLGRESPCDPKTLARAAREFIEREPHFAHGAGVAALYWLVRGQGYEITSIDVWGAYHSTLKAAEELGTLGRHKNPHPSARSPGGRRRLRPADLRKGARAGMSSKPAGSIAARPSETSPAPSGRSRALIRIGQL